MTAFLFPKGLVVVLPLGASGSSSRVMVVVVVVVERPLRHYITYVLRYCPLEEEEEEEEEEGGRIDAS